MDYRTCICPHCGKEVPVPDEMQAFSCIFCGSQITFSQPENPDATLWDCYFDAASYVSRMNYQEYKSAFTEYLNKCLPTLRSLDAMTAADASVAAAQAQVLVDGILSRRPEEIKGKNNYERNAIESRDQMFLALYLIPGILAAKLPSSEMLSQAVRDTWNRQYPKMKISIGTYESIAAGFHRKFFGLCFITTAVCEFFAKPDDCEELTLLRHFRDTYMAATPQGQALIREYYEIAPRLVILMDLCCDRESVYTGLYYDYILPCVEMIREGRQEDCLAHYCEMVRQLQARFSLAA
ncbi:MAG: hypothetical protein PUF71_08835 [Firmicutes bacterium]|nr:hypothetical protein [Bacillota bacterium]